MEELRELLHQRIAQVDFEQAKEDVVQFIKHPDALDIWSQSYFQELVGRVVCQQAHEHVSQKLKEITGILPQDLDAQDVKQDYHEHLRDKHQ